MAIKTEDIILSGCLTKEVREIRERVKAEYLSDPFKQKVFQVMVDFYQAQKMPISKQALVEAFRDEKSGDILKLEVALTKLHDTIDVPVIRQSIENIKKEYQSKSLTDLATEVLNESRDKTFEQLSQEMKAKIVEIEANIDNRRVVYDFTGEDVVEAYHDRLDFLADKDRNIRYSTGLTILDKYTTGGGPKELWTVAAKVRHGKSTMLYNIAHNVVVEQQKNIAYFDAEMGIEKLMMYIYTLHASKVLKIPGIDTRDIVNGDMSPSMVVALKEAAWDLSQGSKSGKYGKFLFMPVSGLSIIDVHLRCEEINDNQFKLDAMFVDYIQKLAAIVTRRDNKNEEYNDTYRYVEQIKLNFDKGRGLWCLTGHQMNREGVRFAEKHKGIYSDYHLSSANEAERTSDVVIGLFRGDDIKGHDSITAGKTELIVNIIKNRTGGIVTGEEPFSISSYWKEARLANADEKNITGERSYEEDVTLGEKDELDNDDVT